MRIVIEIQDGSVVNVTADGAADVVFMDYDNFDDQPVTISRHRAEVDSPLVAEVFKIAAGQ